MRERKYRFIKNNVTRNIHAIGRNVETLITFVYGAIAEEHTVFGAELKLALVVGTEMRPTRTTEHFKESIIRDFT